MDPTIPLLVLGVLVSFSRTSLFTITGKTTTEGGEALLRERHGSSQSSCSAKQVRPSVVLVMTHIYLILGIFLFCL